MDRVTEAPASVLTRTQQTVMDAVIPSLKRGVISFNNLASKLLITNVSCILKSDVMFVIIRSIIEEAQKSLGQSEQAASRELYRIDTHYEELTVQKGVLERNKTEKIKQRDNLTIELGQCRQTLNSCKISLEMAKRKAQDANQMLQDARNRQEESVRLRDAGIGLLAIPIIGWIAGPIMIDAGQKDCDNAVYAANQATRVVQNFESDIANYSSKVSQCTTNMSQINSKITQLCWEIEGVEHEISAIKQQRTVISDIQNKMRSAVNLLGSLSKSSNSAELETRHIMVLRSLINILQHLFELSAKILGHQFYTDTEVKELVLTLLMNQQKLQALPNANKNDALDYLG